MTGYSQVADALAADPWLTANAVRLYLLLLSCDKRRTGIVWPGYDWLATNTRAPGSPKGLSESTLRRELGRLERAGYLTIRKRGGNRSNLYTLLLVVRGGKVAQVDPSSVTGPDLSSVPGPDPSWVTGETEERKQRNAEGAAAGDNSNGRVIGIERVGDAAKEPAGCVAEAIAVPLRGAVGR